MANPGLGAGGAAMLFLGFILIIIGAVNVASCASTPSGPGFQPTCSTFSALLGIGVLFLIIGIVLIVAAAAYGRRPTPPPYNPAVPPPLINPVVIQEKVEREIVRVRCQYCGTLNDETSKTCSSCGAPI